MLIRERVAHFFNTVYRSKGGIWVFGTVVPYHKNILIVRRKDYGKGVAELFLGMNTVTNAGDEYYAERSAAETPSTDFSNTTAGIRLGSSSAAVAKTDTDVTTFVTGANTAHDATYPKTSDADVDNTGSGADIITWRHQFGGAAFSAAIKEGAIVNNDGTPTSALTHWTITQFTKTNSDTLKIFTNHEMS